MADRLVVELNPDGTASVLTWPEGDDQPQATRRFPLACPLDGDALEDLRWYLEDYLILPTGVYSARGEQTRQSLPGWGVALFEAVFGSDPARRAYTWLRGRPGKKTLVFRSAVPELLALPWELMRDPAVPRPLALELAGMSRSLAAKSSIEVIAAPGRTLRVLMVVARPAEEHDVGYQMIARPLLERLHTVRGEVDLTILRPPTLEAMEAALAQAERNGVPFHVVHFDGHGGQAGEGFLVFEKPLGGARLVSANRVAQVLAKVPVVVLNACQSASIGTDLAATVATRLLQAGTPSVVAMAYSVYAVAAAEFMAAFYERLFAGDPVSAAVTAGRRQMFANSKRPSRKGDLPLADWLIPVHYLSRDVRFPQAVTPRTAQPSLDEQLGQLRTAKGSSTNARDLEPVGAFIGRDWLTCRLETAIRLHRVVLLHGIGGTGKTELAKAFGRWLQATGGVGKPEHVFFYSFEPGAAISCLEGLVNHIGRQLFRAADFDRLGQSERRTKVENALLANRMLLICDNFETVFSMPSSDSTSQPWDEAERSELCAFLTRQAQHGSSAVLITSRSPEPWFDGICRIAVPGLSVLEANQYADYLLAHSPEVYARRSEPAFGALMDWLDGNPLSMRVVLPLLETTDPAAILDSLRATNVSPDRADENGDRMASLSASIAYSYLRLPETTRRRLPAVSLLQSVADTYVLARFSEISSVPDRFLGITEDQWLSVLGDAASTGLLAERGPGLFTIHPALHAYLAWQWRKEDAEGYDANRDAAVRALVFACAGLSDVASHNIARGNTTGALNFIDFNRHTLIGALRYALAQPLWDLAGIILQALARFWSAKGYYQEISAWTDRAITVIQETGEEDVAADSPERYVLTLLVSFARDLLPGQASADANERIAALMEARPEFGTVGLVLGLRKRGDRARSLGELVAAEKWYRQALARATEAGDSPGSIEEIYVALGDVVCRQRRLDEAERWCRMALAIHMKEDLTNRYTLSDCYRTLGMIAMERRQYSDAGEWYRRSLAVCRELDDVPRLAHLYSKLGEAADRRGNIDAAEDWYRRTLVIGEEHGEEYVPLEVYTGLAWIALSRDRFADAENWCQQEIAAAQNNGTPASLSRPYYVLSAAAFAQGDLRKTLEMLIRCVAVFDEFPHPSAGEGPPRLAVIAQHLGMDVLEQAWQRATGEPLPAKVRNYVEGGRWPPLPIPG